MRKKDKTWIICSAEGYIKRGYETYTRELVDNLNKDYPSSSLLVRAAVKNNYDKNTLNIFNLLGLNSKLNNFLSKRIKKFHPHQAYFLHLIGFMACLFPLIFFIRPKTIYVVEGTLYKYLFYFKKYIYKNLKLIYFTGGQLIKTLPVNERIFLHHVTPCYKDTALKMGFSKDKQFLIPHFTNTNPFSYHNAAQLKNELGINTNALIVLSVGSIDYSVKRMDYVIEEFAKIKREKFLILLGHQTKETHDIINKAQLLLTENEYAILTVSKDKVDQYYQLADIVVSASKNEGFGLMYIEALANKKIPIVHDFPVARYVLDKYAIFRDLSLAGELSNAIENYDSLIHKMNLDSLAQFMNERYAWQNQSGLYYKFILN